MGGCNFSLSLTLFIDVIISKFRIPLWVEQLIWFFEANRFAAQQGLLAIAPLMLLRKVAKLDFLLRDLDSNQD